MPIEISRQLDDELLRPRAAEAMPADPDAEIDLAERVGVLELRQRELHALVLEVRDLLRELAPSDER